MIIKKAGYEIIRETDQLKKIERIARVCYKSEDKIEEGTDVKMIKNLIKRQHTAMLEHGSIAFFVSEGLYEQIMSMSKNALAMRFIDDPVDDFHNNYLRFSNLTISEGQSRYIISGNLRAWIQSFESFANNLSWTSSSIYEAIRTVMKETWALENDVESINNDPVLLITDYEQLAPQERIIHEDLSVLFTTDRGVTHEMVRHREASFAQESTRYCNYSLGKHGNEITVIEPCFWQEGSEMYNEWKQGCEDAEKHYMKLIENEAQPQQARGVLPTSVKAEITMTATLGEWRHILKLRACDSTGPAHPQIKEMLPLLKELQMTDHYKEFFEDLGTEAEDEE